MGDWEDERCVVGVLSGGTNNLSGKDEGVNLLTTGIRGIQSSRIKFTVWVV